MRVEDLEWESSKSNEVYQLKALFKLKIRCAPPHSPEIVP